MARHFLLKKAFTYPVRKDLQVSDCSYEPRDGYWRNDSDSSIVVRGNGHDTIRMTKKHDIETGEDQKGE